ncbi:Obg family GTPase CgtA [Candidatus Microgenomates bacterium]|nr:Obg family GTPase CgtA [Candidatus Microgenomates bacterium]
MLVDEMVLRFKGGDGGEGKVSFGKGAKSGPDGGNGGDGGDLFIKSSSDLTLLEQFIPDQTIAAEDGGMGGKKKTTGKRGDDLVVILPIGSKVTDIDTNQSYELDKLGQIIQICHGGKGGIGNFELRSSTNTTPKSTKPATPGQTRPIKISMRFIADAGLIGLPSAGKSSLLNELTNTSVKTAEYHFTTLSPNLGVLPNKKILADIPGLIEGAHEGKGLGIKFLKHIQKVTLILHCISVVSEDPVGDYKAIRNELGEFDKELLEKQEVILLTKIDLVDEKTLKTVEKSLKKLKIKIIPTSIHDMESIESLLKIL